MLAHIGGLPIQESLIYLVPPLVVVGWIFLLGRRDRRNPRPEADDEDRIGAPAGARGDVEDDAG